MLKANLGFPVNKTDKVSFYLTVVCTNIVFWQKKIVLQLFWLFVRPKTNNSILLKLLILFLSAIIYDS